MHYKHILPYFNEHIYNSCSKVFVFDFIGLYLFSFGLCMGHIFLDLWI